jgi:lysophospholipase L1-like esterase
MGVPDRCQRTEDGIRTLKEVKNLVNLQQQMAADCKVSFLNFFEVMGGEGSVKKLVDRNMADKDYTHLSFSGGKFIASKLFPSFVEGLNNYKKRIATIER